MQTGCRYTVVIIETILRTGRCGVRFSAEARNFSILRSDTLALGPTQPRIQWVIGVLSTRIKQPGREFDHLPPSCAQRRRVALCVSSPSVPSWR